MSVTKLLGRQPSTRPRPEAPAQALSEASPPPRAAPDPRVGGAGRTPGGEGQAAGTQGPYPAPAQLGGMGWEGEGEGGEGKHS